MLNLKVSENIGKLTKKDQSLLVPALLDEFGHEDITLRVGISQFGQNCILQEQQKAYLFLLSAENVVYYKERENQVKAIMKHEHGHIPFLEVENIFSPHLLTIFKKLFGIGSFTEEEITNHIKIATQNRIIDGDIFDFANVPIKVGLLGTYVEEQLENIKTLPSIHSPLFAPTVLDILQKAGTIRFAKNERLFEGVNKQKANFVMRLFHESLRNQTLRYSHLQNAIDVCYQDLVEANNYGHSWNALKKSFNEFMELL